jgi:hypothetical protein
MCCHSAETFIRPVVSQSNPNTEVRQKIVTCPVTIMKPGLATSCASYIVLSADMYWTMFTANRVTVFRSATSLKIFTEHIALKHVGMGHSTFLAVRNSLLNISHMEFMLENVKLITVPRGPTGCVCDLEISKMRRPRPDLCCSVTQILGLISFNVHSSNNVTFTFWYFPQRVEQQCILHNTK